MVLVIRLCPEVNVITEAMFDILVEFIPFRLSFIRMVSVSFFSGCAASSAPRPRLVRDEAAAKWESGVWKEAGQGECNNKSQYLTVESSWVFPRAHSGWSRRVLNRLRGSQINVGRDSRSSDMTSLCLAAFGPRLEGAGSTPHPRYCNPPLCALRCWPRVPVNHNLFIVSEWKMILCDLTA